MQWITFLFPLWIFISSGTALYKPEIFTWLKGDLIIYSLGLIMLSMGITLTFDDFKRILSRPMPIALGVFLQFTVMPLSRFFISKLFNLSPELSAGVILVSSCPGGTASNVLTYLAKADVALSVTLTTVSTFLAIILTPAITALLVGNEIKVDTIGLIWSTFKVVVIPVISGILISKYFKEKLSYLLDILPFISIILIILIVSSVIGSRREIILQSGIILGSAIFLVHSIGFLIGYLMAKTILKNEITSRTISIEVGMQNSGLGVLLAKENFASVLVSVPPAISSLFHSLISSFLVFIWRLLSKKEIKDSNLK
ncbi:MAG: bile acid:sodium symporter family protein [Leptospiraceae bacterium]|nr:bile acid:sodium symporter family protein [Leptospiraceae bacterium]